MKKYRRVLNRNNLLASVIIIATLGLIALSAYFKLIPLTEVIDDEGIAQKDVYAPYEFYDEEGTIKKAEAEAAAVDPVLITMHDATFAGFEDITGFFDDVDNYRLDIAQYDGPSEQFNTYVSNRVTTFINMCLKKDIKSDLVVGRKLLSGINNAEYQNFKSAVTSRFSSMQNSDVFAGNRDELLENYESEIRYSVMDTDLATLGVRIANSFLRINSIVNEEQTALNRDEAKRAFIRDNPIIIKEGQLLVSAGEKVDADTLRILDAMELTGAGEFNEMLFIGIMGLLLFLFIPILVFKVLFKQRYSKRHILAICVLELLIFILVFLIPGDLKYYIPIFFLPMLTAILVDEKIAVMTGMMTAVFLSFVFKAGPTYLAVMIGGSVVSAYIAKKIHERMKLLASGLAIGVTAALIMVFATMAANGQPGDVIYDIIVLIANGMVSVILVIGLLPLFESVFNIITPFKLLELANPNRPLLKRLLVEAPGTYHHSLMVGNLAEEAANEIGANGLLARVGAYYHDVGKISHPMYYKENQSGEENPHNRMKPEMSKLVITSHTAEGDEIARKYKLPHVIRDFIKEHHGTTQVKYFYNKALGENGGEIDPDSYRYEGPRPKSKETAVVMLADSVEATVRAKGELDRDQVEAIIRKSIKDKLDDGQFDLCDLTLKDFDAIANAFMRVFGGYFHKRIDYPEPPDLTEENFE